MKLQNVNILTNHKASIVLFEYSGKYSEMMCEDDLSIKFYC